jgi:uncharacterized protein YjdB
MDRTIQGRGKRDLFLSLSIAGVLLSSVSCDAGTFLVDPLAAPDQQVFGLSPTEMTLGVGDSATITPTLVRSNGDPVNPRSLKWASTDPSRATVTTDGVVTGVAQGQALIVATSGNLADTTWLRIVEQREARAGVKISPDTVVLQWLNATATLTAELRDDMGTLIAQPGLTWRSLNPEFAQANDMGVVTAKGVGMALIVATAACCDQADTAYARVHQVVDEVVIEEENLSLSEGSSAQLRPIALDRGGSRVEGAKFQFKSADESIVRVSHDGQLTSQSAGTTTVTATSEGHSDQVSVTVSGTDTAVGGIDYPNQPDGFVKITEHRGSPWPSDWWLHNPNNNISVVQDDNAPVPTWATIRYRYPEGHPGGSGVGIMGHGSGNGGAAKNMKVGGQPVREIYLRYYAMHSVGWQNPEGTSKMGYTYQMEPDGSSRNVLHFDVEGHGVKSSYNTKVTSETRGSVQNLYYTDTDVWIKPGVWNLFEMYSKAASAEGVQDGIVKWWVNGTLVINRSGIRRSWHPFTELHWAAVWGGGSSVPVQQEQYIYYNGLYISGR